MYSFPFERWLWVMNAEEDKDISIDLGKVKSFFKRERKEEKKTEDISAKIEDKKGGEEISIDFNKIKRFFESDKTIEDSKGKKDKESDEMEFSFDFSKIKKILALAKKLQGAGKR